MERVSISAIGEAFNLDGIIAGLAQDLVALRDGRIGVNDAVARANLAKQIFNGLRLVINGRKILQSEAITRRAAHPEPSEGA